MVFQQGRGSCTVLANSAVRLESPRRLPWPSRPLAGVKLFSSHRRAAETKVRREMTVRNLLAIVRIVLGRLLKVD